MGPKALLTIPIIKAPIFKFCAFINLAHDPNNSQFTLSKLVPRKAGVDSLFIHRRL